MIPNRATHHIWKIDDKTPSNRKEQKTCVTKKLIHKLLTLSNTYQIEESHILTRENKRKLKSLTSILLIWQDF